jgi:predicted RNase H-like HicB family nuclease
MDAQSEEGDQVVEGTWLDPIPRRQASGEDDEKGMAPNYSSATQGPRLLTRAEPGDSQAGRTKMKRTSPMELTARIHIEDGSYWADVPELPGCFAAGDTLDELFDSLQEGVGLLLADKGEQSAPLHVATATLTDRPLSPA